MSDIYDFFFSVPPKEKFLKVVVKHLDGEHGDEYHHVDIAEDERGHEDDGSPFVDCHFLSDPPSVSQMDIDDVEVFLFEVLSFDWEIIEEGFIVDIEEGTFGVFEEVADLLLLVF